MEIIVSIILTKPMKISYPPAENLKLFGSIATPTALQSAVCGVKR